jgi:hypothetical protein
MAIAANVTTPTAEVVRKNYGTLSANASDLATAITLINEMKQVLKNMGVVS